MSFQRGRRIIGGGSGGDVQSVNGKTGIVNLNAKDIPFSPIGNITSTEVQSALEEVDTKVEELIGGFINDNIDESYDHTYSINKLLTLFSQKQNKIYIQEDEPYGEDEELWIKTVPNDTRLYVFLDDKWQEVNSNNNSLSFYESPSLFPQIGNENVLYIDLTTPSLHIWDNNEQKYMSISSKNESGTVIDDWKPNTEYKTKDIIINDSQFYRCSEDHLSSTNHFEDDLFYWELIGSSDDTYFETDDPQETDNTLAGFSLGQLWINHVDKKVWLFICEMEDEENNIKANWVELTGNSSVFEKWEPFNAYQQGKIVLHNFKFYQSIQSHISSSTFEDDIENWQIIGVGNGTNLASEILVASAPSSGIITDTNVQHALETIGNQAERNRENTLSINNNLLRLDGEVKESLSSIEDHEDRINQIENGSFDKLVKASESDPEAGYLIDKIDNNTLNVDLVNHKMNVVKLNGQTATIDEINQLSGVTSNIQSQIDALSLGMQWQGEVLTYQDLLLIESPENGWTFIVEQDETKENSRTFYVYSQSSNDWIFLGDVSFINDATLEIKGVIKISGDLTGTADSIQLKETGVLSGAYINPTIFVDSKGRITYASNGTSESINTSMEYQVVFPPEERENKRLFTVPEYSVASKTLEVYVEGIRLFPDFHYIEKSPTEVEFLFDVPDSYHVAFISARWDRGLVGSKQVDESAISNQKVLMYDSTEDKLVYSPLPSGTFLGLSDTPNEFMGNAGKILAVDPLEQRLEFITPPTSGGAGGVIVNNVILTGLYELVASNNIKITTNEESKKVYIRLSIEEWTSNKNYHKGELVLLPTLQGNDMYVCTSNHTSTFDFNADKTNWKTISSSGNGGVPVFKEIEANVVVLPQSSNFVSLDVPFDKYDIRTVKAQSLEEKDIKVTIYDKSTNGDLVYESLVKNSFYDIVNVPVEDKDSSKKLHIFVNNYSEEATTVNIKIKITSLS